MPEGDTIFRAARTLHRALAGETITGFETVLPNLARVDDDSPIPGRHVESVSASGKWTLMRLSGGLILLTHMLMSGSWHIYRPGERWQRSRRHMRIVIETEKILAVAFDVPVAEFHTQETLARRRGFNRLGPDVLASEFDKAAAVANLASRPDLELGVALLSQSVLAGLGNVFKSEICFAERVNPFRRIASINAVQLASIVSASRKLMLANVRPGATHFRRTTGRMELEEGLWVYGRAGQPCRACGTPIRSYKQGEDARVTFWCPTCQPSVVC